MNALRHSRVPVAGRNFMRVASTLLLVSLAAIAFAQDVPVTQTGVSPTASIAIYNDKYVLWRTDFGFFWLDTVALRAGHVQAESKCGPWPASDSNIYVIGDCNGITGIKSSGSNVLVRQLTGNCLAATRGCGGPRDDGHLLLLFNLGSWNYTGDYPDDGCGGCTYPNSTQTADLSGRTWTLQIVDIPTGKYNWHASGDPNAPPATSASATNNSAASRSDKTNYFGDQWTLQDTSSSIATITQVDWDFVYGGTFGTDLTEGPGQSHSFPFPCDPGAGGNLSSGSGCWASVGSPSSGSYTFALKAYNGKPGSPTQFTSSSIAVAGPQISIKGLSGTTLQILTGGNADASATQGNTANATFAWNFSPGGAPSCTQPCKIVAVPANAISYQLTVTYPGGYNTSLSGAVQQVDLVPAFSLSPSSVLVSASLTLTNQMQKSTSPSVILNSVNYAIASGACGSAPAFSTFLSGSFLPVNGNASVTAPGSAGSYCMWLQYNFTDHNNQPQSLTTSNPFSAVTWAPNPQIAFSPLPICFATCQLTKGTAYSLSDNETILITPHPGAVWQFVTSSGTTTIGSPADANTPISWTPTSTCSSGCSLKLTVSGVSVTQPVTVSNPAPPGSLSVSLSGPTSAAPGQSVTFTASVSNAQGSVSYAWNFGENPLGGLTPGPAVNSHTYSAAGTYNVVVSATDSSSTASASWQITVAPTGPPPPKVTFTATGATNSGGNTWNATASEPITLTATETAATAYGWDTGDGPPSQGKTIIHTYANQGTYTLSLLVYGNGTTTATGPYQGTYTFVIAPPAGPPLPSTEFSVQGATRNTFTGNYDAYSGVNLVFTASENNATQIGWDFGDGTTAAGKTAVKTYTTPGTRTARLLVWGDGTTKSVGPAQVSFTLNITQAPFQASIVPGVAHLDDGTTTWGTDVSVTNAGTSAMTINLAFLPLLPDAVAPTSVDLAQVAYGSSISLGPGGSWSANDVVTYLNGGLNKGTLVIKYSGGSQAPLVSTRVYFAPKVNPSNISYGSGLPAYEVDSSGRISAQGFVSVALSASTSGIQTDSIQAIAGTVTVNKTGTGTGTVTSNPAGIDCGATCSFSFPAGTTVSLSGSADAGSVFVGWTGCSSVVLGQCIATGSNTVTAQFDASGPPPTNPTLTVSKSGTGTGTVSSAPAGINCGATCSAQFASGSSVTLTATPNTGSTFAGWGGACSGTGSCSVTLSADQSVTAAFNTAGSAPQLDQLVIGLKSDLRYRFGITLFNASGSPGTFRLAAMDENSSPLLISDGAGGQVAYRDFATKPYQQWYLTNDDLALTDSNKRYVLKATRTSTTGTLLAFGTALDRTTRDFAQYRDDSQISPAEASVVSYWVAGVSRYDSSYGAHWRTDLRIYNRGSRLRNLYFEYSFTSDGVTEHVAHVGPVAIAAGDLLTYDDAIGSLLNQDTNVDLSGSTAGILKILYPWDDDSDTRPLIIASRNYDDQPTGTAGSQLAVYTRAQAADSTKSLFLTGAEESLRYSSRIGVFAMDPGPVTGRIVAIASDGTEVGSIGFALGGSSPHYGQLSLTGLANFQNPNTPVSIRIDQIGGGRLGAYAFTVDKVTLDTNFIQALPK